MDHHGNFALTFINTEQSDAILNTFAMFSTLSYKLHFTLMTDTVDTT